jgi:uncharacterized repeat protein (TIGR01451 family)
VASLCSSHRLRHSRRGRLLTLAFILLGGLALLLDASAEVRAQAAPTADLTVSKSGDEAAPVNGQITYNISVFNGGPDDATNVVLTDPLPAHTTYGNVSTSQGSINFDGTTVTASFGMIPAFQNATVTFTVSVNNDTPRGTTISNTATASTDASDPNGDDNSATALTVITGPFAGDILISEFRLRGPGGPSDEYVEIYNNADAPHFVNSTDGSAGYAIAASDGVIRCTIPNGTIIPRRGHFLCVNSVGYSLDLHPAGEDTTATGDISYTTDIPDNTGIAIFRTSNTENFSLVNRLDAAGSTSETNELYKEGTGYSPLSQMALDYAFYRDNCGKAGSVTAIGSCTTAGLPKDTDNNASDFVFVEPNGNNSGAGARLGAPGPENFSSPSQRNASFGVNPLDPCIGSSSPPNRVRSFTSDPANNSTFGTLDIRRTVTNSTGENVTRLRWRIIDISTFPVPSGVADLRARTSTPVVVTVDRLPCGSETSSVTVQGTILEQPPSQPNGGGFNSSLSSGTVTLQTPLADGESIDVRFLLGIQQTGTFRFFINVEALTRESEIVPEKTPTARPRKGINALPSAKSSKGARALPAKTGRGVRK